MSKNDWVHFPNCQTIALSIQIPPFTCCNLMHIYVVHIKHDAMKKNFICMSHEGTIYLASFSCCVNIALQKSSKSIHCHHPSTTLFSAPPKLSFGYKTEWGLRITFLNRLPTGGEVVAPAGSDSCSPSLTHQVSPLLLSVAETKAKARRASGKLMVPEIAKTAGISRLVSPVCH